MRAAIGGTGASIRVTAVAVGLMTRTLRRHGTGLVSARCQISSRQKTRNAAECGAARRCQDRKETRTQSEAGLAENHGARKADRLGPVRSKPSCTGAGPGGRDRPMRSSATSALAPRLSQLRCTRCRSHRRLQPPAGSLPLPGVPICDGNSQVWSARRRAEFAGPVRNRRASGPESGTDSDPAPPRGRPAGSGRGPGP